MSLYVNKTIMEKSLQKWVQYETKLTHNLRQIFGPKVKINLNRLCIFVNNSKITKTDCEISWKDSRLANNIISNKKEFLLILKDLKKNYQTVYHDTIFDICIYGIKLLSKHHNIKIKKEEIAEYQYLVFQYFDDGTSFYDNDDLSLEVLAFLAGLIYLMFRYLEQTSLQITFEEWFTAQAHQNYQKFTTTVNEKDYFMKDEILLAIKKLLPVYTPVVSGIKDLNII